MEMYRKSQATGTAKAKAKAKVDRISDLPDSILHHILSFLPTTKQAIQTAILSKRWLNQWTNVPVLIFDDSTGMSHENFLKFVNNTLIRHNCSKIKKFHLEYPYLIENDPQFDQKVLFATRKHVEELNLISERRYELLPQFTFNANWGSLTALRMQGCKLTDQAVHHILSGSPLLQSFELINYYHFDKLVIASKSLKRLVLRQDSYSATISAIQISCPNLVELSLTRLKIKDAELFAQAIEDALSTSPLLESFELIEIYCSELHQLVIVSKSLKRLILNFNYYLSNLVISCPHLEQLKLFGCSRLKTATLPNLPSSLCPTFDFYNNHNEEDEVRTLVKDILHQLHHLNELMIGSLFIKILSALEVGDLFPFVLNVKSLTLNSPNLNNHYSGITSVLRHAPELEKLVINEPIYDRAKLELDDFGENPWNSEEAAVINCLVSHLKTVKIIGFPKRNDELKFLTSFVQFLLNNARVLEKMVIITRDRTNVPLRISHKLLHLPRCSKHAIIELQYSPNELCKIVRR